ncbi:MAG TPA: hypothetical protein VG797_02805 [Phycisphaerales bacterium]|nr:hypothetical protein [Phycisphaerales bacterium]
MVAIETSIAATSETFESPRVSPLLTHDQLVNQIRTLNPSATSEYLARFDGPALAVYLRHLLSCLEPRGRAARWQRPGDTPAIIRAIPRDE